MLAMMIFGLLACEAACVVANDLSRLAEHAGAPGGRVQQRHCVRGQLQLW